jgi:hypothetical protein
MEGLMAELILLALLGVLAFCATLSVLSVLEVNEAASQHVVSVRAGLTQAKGETNG